MVILLPMVVLLSMVIRVMNLKRLQLRFGHIELSEHFFRILSLFFLSLEDHLWRYHVLSDIIKHLFDETPKVHLNFPEFTAQLFSSVKRALGCAD